ncbi:type I restriction endonuclease subunit R [Bartonella sp. DGB1]|uniref:type I restriction endonuclease subunit R n=1 Tax=Bartonella sp. DGB1 TaxID=3239807 RepID=UPI00352646F7
MSIFNEANTIEQALIDRLSALKGNKWTFVHGNELPRTSDNDVLIEHWLKDALCRLNPDIAKDPAKADKVIYKLRCLLYEAKNKGLVSANELFVEWLRAEKSMPLGENDQHITINLIDYNDYSKNHYVVSRQVAFTGSQKAFFDLVLYVNGIPLVVGELKTPSRPAISWQDGAADFNGGKKHYWNNQSSFFIPNLLCFATEGKTFAYGAINADFKNWMPWHKTTDGDEIEQNLSMVLTSAEDLLKPQTLLELLQSFALYSTAKLLNSEIKRIKLLPRYPQYEAVKQIVERVKEGKIRKGLIWHFQGSGKSLLMLYAAKMLKTDPELKNPTVVVVVDRVDLDSQINTTFDNADVKNVTAIKSCKQLSEALERDDRNILITTIFKFDDVIIDEKNKNGLNSRENIIVLVDEAHRTQEGMLGEKMRWALPNAYFFGLTGTPISGIERNTFRLFGADQDNGRYMNRYSYKQSIRDQATLPVKFEPRLVKLRVDQAAIDEAFEELAKNNNLNEEEKTQLSQKAGNFATLIKAPKRMEAIAKDIHEHFTDHVEPKGLKAMVVVYDRESCVIMYDLLTKIMGEGSCEVIMNISQGEIDEEKFQKNNSKKKADDWVKWENLGLPLNKEAFKRWQAIDADPVQQEKILNQYRDSTNPLKILIVTAKLLTGFDAPICYCMYLDKPLRDHTLLQAMCRTNRLYNESKQHGLIIDYLGVFENLAKALSYDQKEIEGVIEQLSKYKEQVPVALEACLAFFEGIDRTTEGYEALMLAQNCLPSNEMRDQFAAQFNVLKKLWEALAPDPFLTQFQNDYRWLAKVYNSLRPIGGSGSLLWKSLGTATIQLIHQHTDIDQIKSDLEELIIDENSIFALTEAEQKQKAQLIEIRLIAKIRKKAANPKYIELGKRIEKLREKYEVGVLTSIEWLKSLIDAARETVLLDNTTEDDDKIIEDNKKALSELFKEVRNDQTPNIISHIVDDIDELVHKNGFENWQDSEAGKRDIKKMLRKTLLKYQLHKDEVLFEKAYAYIMEHY